MLRIFCLAIILFTSANAFATDHVWVNEPQNLKWQAYSDGKVYFRNLNEFPGGAYQNNFQGCCMKYWIDTTTEGGKSLWSTILTHIISNKPFYITKANASVDGHIQNIGVW